MLIAETMQSNLSMGEQSVQGENYVVTGDERTSKSELTPVRITFTRRETGVSNDKSIASATIPLWLRSRVSSNVQESCLRSLEQFMSSEFGIVLY